MAVDRPGIARGNAAGSSRRPLHQFPLLVLSGLLACYLAVPIGAFIVRLVRAPTGFAVPGLWSALVVSIVTATISLAVITIFGLPLAYVLARSRRRSLKALGVVCELPLALPPLMGGILLVYLVGPYTALGRFFGHHLTESLIGIVLAQSFVAAPFLLAVARAAFASVDPSLLDMAATLGRGEWSRFATVAIPSAREGIRAGMLLAWLRAFGEYGATVVLAYHPYSLPVFTYLQFSGTGLPATVAPTALGLGVAGAVVALIQLRPKWRARRVETIPTPKMPSLGTPVLLDFDLRLQRGTFSLELAYRARTSRIGILGPSGSGKSLTLRALAGIFGAEPGRVAYDGVDVSNVPVEARLVGYVSQHLSLLPHLPVWRQLLFGVGADAQLAAYWVERLGLRELVDRFPEQISGGQRQRVCLAQALSRSPRIVLLDEPFSALDAPVREQLRDELRQLQRERGMSTVLVTHDPVEAAILADEILVVESGRLLQAGSRSEVFSAPASPAVARLLGIRNIATGTVAAPGRLRAGPVELAAPTRDLPPGSKVLWSVPPELVEVGARDGVSATVLDVIDRGSSAELVVELASGVVLRAIGRTSLLQVVRGSSVSIGLPTDAVTCWSASEQDGTR